MSITILPARLANQIAAGEVVERPASVVKELVENSLDAGATHIQIDIEKGGTKRIRIIDNGKGIVKDELTLALSRHATSKIKNLDDLEAISSLGFRGEALASISSVARLTLTSKPASQDLAWQAYAEGRDMEVVLKPAAHPNGTTIDVVDLFFNTPARRKFLRTEKTEFTHIEEVIKRIALARFDVSFVLNHNGKTVKQYRKIQSEAQNIKRIASVCGQTFVEHAIEINCQHDDIHLSGWIAKPSYTRKQNDLCYSYVNGRMMRDKLINHAIRQAYGEFIDNDVYSAFVLFLSVDFKDVDVNVHPAKHEVRFHQSRYVHDFIYTVCHKALAEQIVIPTIEDAAPGHVQYQEINSESSLQSHLHADEHSNNEISEINRADRSYVTPLKQEQQTITPQTSQRYNQPASSYQHRNTVSPRAAANYQTLMSVEYDKQQAISNSVLPEAIGTQHVQASPLIDEGKVVEHDAKMHNASIKLLFVHQDKYIVYQQKMKDESRLAMSLITPLSQASQYEYIVQCWRDKAITSEQQALISQPLLLPVKIKLLPEQKLIVEQYQSLLFMSGIHSVVQQNYLQIRQFPALLRTQDVANVFEHLLLLLVDLHEQLSAKKLTEEQLLTQWQQSIAKLAVPTAFTLTEVQQLFKTLSNENESTSRLNSLLSLNSAVIDLTSLTSQLDELLLPSSH